MSFETSFDSKQPKLEPKLVSALSETKGLFRLFRFYTETESLDVSIEPKQTGDQPKQFDREHILLFFTENVVFFRFFSIFFGFFLGFFSVFSVFSFFSVFSVCFETVCFGCLASIPKQRVSIEPKQTEDPPKSLKESIFGNFSKNLGLFWFVLVCYETDLFVLIVSIEVRNTETNRNFFFLVSRNKPKQTRNRSCFGLFRFEPKIIFVCFEDTLPLMSAPWMTTWALYRLQFSNSQSINQ